MGFESGWRCVDQVDVLSRVGWCAPSKEDAPLFYLFDACHSTQQPFFLSTGTEVETDAIFCVNFCVGYVRAAKPRLDEVAANRPAVPILLSNQRVCSS